MVDLRRTGQIGRASAGNPEECGAVILLDNLEEEGCEVGVVFSACLDEGGKGLVY